MGSPKDGHGRRTGTLDLSSLESPLPATEDLSLGEVLESDSPTPEHFYAQ
jgi:hypothetical protein